MAYLFFDTETNGLPKNYKEKPSSGNNWPRIIQIGWVLTDSQFNIIEERQSLIKPDGWIIPNEKFWIDNGYSTEKNEQAGNCAKYELDILIDRINLSTHVLAHNMDFDYPVIASEMLRYGKSATNKPQRICTMKATTSLCRLPGPYGFKWPKLEELHQFLFGENFDGAHDALADVKATVRCAAELSKIGVLKF